MPYPPAPWHTHGRAFVQPYLVDAAQLRLPAGFAPVTVAGRALGVLGLVEYTPPSPLTYAELVWMPCLVTATTATRPARGYFVEKMYVDSPDSLAGGRELWALPKQLARFTLAAGEATVETEDGARLVLELAIRGPAARAPIGGATIQAATDALVRFRGSGTARIGSARVRVREARGTEGWMGFATARRLPGLGVALRDFAITMHPPKRLAWSRETPA